MGLETSYVVRTDAWMRLREDTSGEILKEQHAYNVITIDGRKNAMNLLLGLGGGTITALAIGASGTAANENDHGLTYELVGASPRLPFTNLAGATISTADYTSQTISDGDLFFYNYITLVSISTANDGNTGQPIQEIGLMTSSSLPSSPTTLSGTMFNHIVFGTPFIKTPNSNVEFQVTVRF